MKKQPFEVQKTGDCTSGENNLLDIFHCTSGSVNDNQRAGYSSVSPLVLFNASHSCARFLVPALAFGDEMPSHVVTMRPIQCPCAGHEAGCPATR